MEDGCQQRLGQHFNNHCSWIPRDNAVPGSCQLLRGHADQDQWKVQTASHLTTTLHISLAFYYISVYEEKRQTVDATIFPLNASWHYKHATLQRMPGQRPPALLGLLKIPARSCVHRSFQFTYFLRKCTGSQELPLCLQFAGMLPNHFHFQKELKQVLCLCKAA